MSDTPSPTTVRESVKPVVDARSRDALQHWSLTPAALPGTDVAAPYPARAWHTRTRLRHLPAWRARLQRLPHHDPDYVYDPGHEYEAVWTTDPHYKQDGVRLYQYDDEGFLTMPHGSFHGKLVELLLETLCLVLGHRVCKVPDLHHAAQVSERLGQFTAADEPRTLRVPDLAVMPPSWTLPAARERTVAERIIRLDRGDPTPEMVLEIVSKSNRDKDFNENLDLYAALGIPEYLVVDTGEFSNIPNLWLYRLHETDRDYRLAESARTVTACGIPMRLQDAETPGNAPVFQCRDAHGRWRDHEGDIALRERMGERMDMALGQLRRVLAATDPTAADRIAAHWTRVGVPAAVADRVLDIAARPRDWQTILGIPDDDDTAPAAGTPAPKEPAL